MNIDYELLKWIQNNRIIDLDPFLQFISKETSSISFGIVVCLILVGLFINQKKIARDSFFILTTLIINALIIFLLKTIINRPRPFISHEDIIQLTSGGSPSMPSGHAAEVFCLAVLVWFTLKNRIAMAVFILWATLIAYSRMALGVHYPMDILVGAAVGSSVAFLCFKIYLKLPFNQPRTS